jgi:hypothetical protein
MEMPGNAARRLISVAALAACACARPGAASAQDVTGLLIGTVKDAQGAVVAGATARVESSALIGGSKATITDEKGTLRFAALPIGDYTLAVEAAGFKPYRSTDVIRIGAGGTIEHPVVLELAGVTDSVVVRGSGSAIDTRDSGIGARFGREELNAYPAPRFSMVGPIRSAPGVSPTSPASGSINSISIFGAGTNENLFLIDGTNFTCPCSGEARSEPGVDFIQEVQIRSVGASAEFGNAQGGIINVITRQGGDLFRYDASYYGQSAALTSAPVRLSLGPGQPTTTYERVKYRDLTLNAGGPAWRNRLWFFAGYQHLRDYDSQPGADPAFPRTYEQDKFFGKLTWRLSPSLLLVQSFHTEQWVNPEVPTFVKPFEATQRLHASVPAVTFGHLTHTLSSRTLWDIRFGRFVYTRHDDPSTGDVTVPSHIDRVTEVMSGAPQTFGGLKLIRTTAKGTVDHYRSDVLGADHHFRIGGQIERGEHHLSQVIPTGTRYIDQGPAPFRAVSAAPSVVGGVFVTTSGFVSHGLTIGSALTINMGVRFDHSQAISQDLQAVDESGRETGETIQGRGRMYTWKVWSPRFGLTLRLTEDGRSVLRGSFGRFHQGVLTGELAPFHPGATPVTTSQFESSTGGYTRFISQVDPDHLKFDPETRPPYTDVWSVGIDRELARSLTVAIAMVHKRGADFIGWTDVAGQYREDTFKLPDDSTVPVFVLTGPTNTRRFMLANQDGYSMHYNGLVLAAEKRRSHGWQAHASYTWSATSGLQASSAAAASGPQVSTIAAARFLTFGQDPNTLTNAEGRLPNDRPQMVRVMVSADVPRTGLVAAANVRHFSGKPWAASVLAPLPQGDVRIQLEERGTRCLSSQTLVDLRLSRTFVLGIAARVELLLDVFNVLDDTAEEGLATDNVVAGNFGQPTAFIDPRRAMVGVRFTFGR